MRYFARHRLEVLTLILSIIFLGACDTVDQNTSTETSQPSEQANGMQAPVADRREQILEAHGDKREDPYYWLRDDKRESPQVLAYLQAENDYAEHVTAPMQALEDDLYQELVARIPANDESVPFRYHQHWYARQYQAGKELPILVRWSQGETEPQGEPEVLLDENQLKGELEFYQVGDYDVSSDDQWLVWTEDVVSRGIYRIRFRNLNTGQTIDTSIEKTGSEVIFANDNRSVFYIRLQDETLIPYQIWRHTIGTSPEQDVLVYQEDDPTYFTTISKSRDQRYIVVGHYSTLTSEVQLIDADQPQQPPQVVIPRTTGHEYQVETLGTQLYLLTNDQAKNFRIVTAPLTQANDREVWQEVLAESPDALISNFAVFNDYVVASITEDANQKLHVIPQDSDVSPWDISADEPAFEMAINVNLDSNATDLRYTYESPAKPLSWYSVDMQNGERQLLKQSFAGEDFDSSKYQVRRINITAHDGTAIPVTLLHRAGLQPDGTHPAYLLGYGSYGSSYLPGFQQKYLSLVDRGFVFALAHIRGGQEKGRAWYEQGKLLNKKNTFTDFIDAGQALIKDGWSAPDKLVASGRSAGGLLIGAVANMAPETFHTLIAGVPFVDVITTMLDESIPLTTFEFDEWGNPKDKTYYDYMLSYSPYDQISAQDYPHIYVTTGLWDPAVQYWEPAKWVAKLRHTKTDDNMLVMRTDMNAGHRGGSGRFERQRDTAQEFAFILSSFDAK